MYNIDSLFIYFIGIFAAMFTAFYSFRLLYWVFFTKANFFKIYTSSLNELNFFMLIPMICLSFFSIVIGYIFYDSFLGIGSIFWNNSIFISLLHYTILDAEFSLFFIKFLPLIFTLLGIIFFFLLNKFMFNFLYKLIFLNKIFWYIFYFFNKALFFDNIINDYFISFILKISYLSIYKYIEKGILELFGPIIIYKMLYTLYFIIKKFNDGLIFNYIFIILWFIIYFIILFEFIIKFELINLFLDLNIIIFILYFIYKYYNYYFLANNILNIENEINKKYYTKGI
jgi:NADH:ubiquinone oxidoreductase subunit 5 (subunit L)/multisubunit Na+/H+ antiporter MnhA subunit